MLGFGAVEGQFVSDHLAKLIVLIQLPLASIVFGIILLAALMAERTFASCW
jgi:hypothetical protein